VFRELLLIIPMGFAAALSPVMLSEQTVLLAGRGGRKAANGFALGIVLVTVGYLSALVVWGQAISLPTRPTLSATMDVIVGGFLVLVAVIIQRRHPKEHQERPARAEMGPVSALGFGVFSMATNFTSLAILLPAAKDITAGSLSALERIALVAIVVVLATVPAWVPIAMTRAAPDTAERVLTSLGNVVTRDGRRVAVILIAVLGLVLVGRGVLHIVET
jgi:hypothetical protein